ncbi:MAG: hypothetical protein QG577_2540 [Thermodesulfobacteriota bacterium]|nr:hypothetical protein [Thermodesulfobacteriota bacterium]
MAILTISREFGSGGREVGQGVSGALKYVCLDKEKLLQILGEKGRKWAEWGKGLDEHSPSVWERYDWSFRGFGALIKRILLDFALKDNVVIMERGGNFLLEHVPHAFRIRVIAPMANRLERIMIRENVDYDTARWLADRTDRDRNRFIMSVFGREWGDPSGFDAIFNAGIQPIEEIIHTVCDTLVARDRLKTKEAEDDLRIRGIAAKVESGLLTKPFLFVSTLEVAVEGDGLVVQGIVRNPEHRKKIEELATDLAGGAKLSFRLHYRMA